MEDSSTGGTGYQASVNQAKDEPIPASHHDQERRGLRRSRLVPARQPMTMSPPRMARQTVKNDPCQQHG
jgi:hypothetical protein